MWWLFVNNLFEEYLHYSSDRAEPIVYKENIYAPIWSLSSNKTMKEHSSHMDQAEPQEQRFPYTNHVICKYWAKGLPCAEVCVYPCSKQQSLHYFIKSHLYLSHFAEPPLSESRPGMKTDRSHHGSGYVLNWALLLWEACALYIESQPGLGWKEP